MRHTSIACFVVSTLVVGCANLSAQTDAGALAGPKVVVDDRPPVGEEAFSGSMQSREMMSLRVPPQVFENAVSDLSGDDVSAGLHMSAEQAEKLDKLRRDHREALIAFLREHRDELAVLQRGMSEMPEARRFATLLEQSLSDEDRAALRRALRERPASGEQAKAPVSADEALARFRELRAAAPSPTTLQAEMWNALTDEQRAFVQGRIDAWQEESDQMRADEYARRLLAQRTGQPGASPPARPDSAVTSPRPAAAPALTTDERRARTLERIPERLRERLMNRSEEERNAFLDRLADRASDAR